MFKEKCKYCNRTFEGYTEKHLENMVNQHILSAHKDKVKIG
jgi:hypothetical protein